MELRFGDDGRRGDDELEPALMAEDAQSAEQACAARPRLEWMILMVAALFECPAPSWSCEHWVDATTPCPCSSDAPCYEASLTPITALTVPSLS